LNEKTRRLEPRVAAAYGQTHETAMRLDDIEPEHRDTERERKKNAAERHACRKFRAPEPEKSDEHGSRQRGKQDDPGADGRRSSIWSTISCLSILRVRRVFLAEQENDHRKTDGDFRCGDDHGEENYGLSVSSPRNEEKATKERFAELRISSIERRT